MARTQQDYRTLSVAQRPPKGSQETFPLRIVQGIQSIEPHWIIDLQRILGTEDRVPAEDSETTSTNSSQKSLSCPPFCQTSSTKDTIAPRFTISNSRLCTHPFQIVSVFVTEKGFTQRAHHWNGKLKNPERMLRTKVSPLKYPTLVRCSLRVISGNPFILNKKGGLCKSFLVCLRLCDVFFVNVNFPEI